MPELLLPRLKREIEARLAELRPVVAEVAQLEAAKRALLDDLEPPSPRRAKAAARSASVAAPPEPPAPSPTRAPRAPRESTMTESRAALRDVMAASREPLGRPAPRAPEPREANGGGAKDEARDAVVEVVEQRPGVSIAEIVSVTKLAKPEVIAMVARLKREGVFADEAGGVKLASRQPLTLSQVTAAIAAPRDVGASDAEWDAARPAKNGKRG